MLILYSGAPSYNYFFNNKTKRRPGNSYHCSYVPDQKRHVLNEHEYGVCVYTHLPYVEVAVQRGRARLRQHNAVTAAVVRSYSRVAATTHAVRNGVCVLIALTWKVLCSEGVLGYPNTRPLLLGTLV